MGTATFIATARRIPARLLYPIALLLLAVAVIALIADARMGGGTGLAAVAAHAHHHAVRILADGNMYHHT